MIADMATMAIETAWPMMKRGESLFGYNWATKSVNANISFHSARGTSTYKWSCNACRIADRQLQTGCDCSLTVARVVARKPS